MPTKAQNANDCSVRESPMTPAGVVDTRATSFHKNTITNGSSTLYSDGET
jgi:hypothetical protein